MSSPENAELERVLLASLEEAANPPNNDPNLKEAIARSLKNAANPPKNNNYANLNEAIARSLGQAQIDYENRVKNEMDYYNELHKSLKDSGIEDSILNAILDKHANWSTISDQLKQYKGKKITDERIKPHFLKLIEFIDNEFSKSKDLLSGAGGNEGGGGVAPIGGVAPRGEVAPRAFLEGDRDPSPVVIIEDGGAGDCFYYALIGALGDKGISPDEFGNPMTVESLRQYVSLHAKPILMRTYNRLKNLGADNAIVVISQSFNAWQIEAYALAQDMDEFVDRYKAGVLIRGNWACQLEVDFFKETLSVLGCELRVLTSPFGELPKTNSRGHPIIHLYNPNDVHYQHFRYIDPAQARPAGRAPALASPSRLPAAKPTGAPLRPSPFKLPAGSFSPAARPTWAPVRPVPSRLPVGSFSLAAKTRLPPVPASPSMWAPVPAFPSTSQAVKPREAPLPAPSVSPAVTGAPVSRTVGTYAAAAAAARKKGGKRTRRKMKRSKKSRKH